MPRNEVVASQLALTSSLAYELRVAGLISHALLYFLFKERQCGCSLSSRTVPTIPYQQAELRPQISLPSNTFPSISTDPCQAKDGQIFEPTMEVLPNEKLDGAVPTRRTDRAPSVPPRMRGAHPSFTPTASMAPPGQNSLHQMAVRIGASILWYIS